MSIETPLVIGKKQRGINFIFNHASNPYLCLYNQLFALYHYVFKFLTP